MSLKVQRIKNIENTVGRSIYSSFYLEPKTYAYFATHATYSTLKFINIK